MLRLSSESDLAVRDAVEAFLAGDVLAIARRGEVFFETKNTSYRLRDGVLFPGTNASLGGAELVGWLLESPGDATVEGDWHAGARAVLVDSRQRRQIIVTSPTVRYEAAPHEAASSPHAPAPPRRVSPPPLPRAAMHPPAPRPRPLRPATIPPGPGELAPMPPLPPVRHRPVSIPPPPPSAAPIPLARPRVRR